jgi:hypothetical protein
LKNDDYSNRINRVTKELDEIVLNNKTICVLVKMENKNKILTIALMSNKKINIDEKDFNDMKDNLLNEIHFLELKEGEIEEAKKMFMEDNCGKRSILDLSKHLNEVSNHKINELEDNITKIRI